MSTIETFGSIVDEYLEKKRRRGSALLSLAEAHRDGMVEGSEETAEYLSARVATGFVHIENEAGLRAALAKHEPDAAAQEAKDGPTLMHARAVTLEAATLLAATQIDQMEHGDRQKIQDARKLLHELLG